MCGDARGGGFYASGFSTVTITNSTFDSNTASGAIGLDGGSGGNGDDGRLLLDRLEALRLRLDRGGFGLHLLRLGLGLLLGSRPAAGRPSSSARATRRVW